MSGERVDRDPGAPDLAVGERVVRVVAQLRRQVEGDREAGLAAREEVAEARVRLLCRAVARVLADRPRPPAVHRLVRAAGERELAGGLERRGREVACRVDGLDLDAGVGQPARQSSPRPHRTFVAARGLRRRVRSRRARCVGRFRCAQRIAVSTAAEVARCERLDDPAVLGDEVRVPLDAATAEDLHHQVHRQVAVEAGEERVSGKVDLVLVERGVRGVPLLVRDRLLGRVRERGERFDLRLLEPSHRALRRQQLQREPHVVALGQRLGGDGRDEVAAPRLHGEQALRDEARQRVVHRAARDAELVREGVQADLASGRVLPREDAPAQLVVHLLVEVHAGEGGCHLRDLTCHGRGGNRWATLLSCKIQVRLFASASASEQARAGSTSRSIRAATVADVWPALGLGDEPTGLLYALNREYVEPRAVLSAGDEVAVIPPVSGGDFRLSDAPLSIDAAVAEVRDDGAGAIATFVGTTRAHSRGRDVLHLEYEAYEGMAEQVMATLAEELEGAPRALEGRDPPSDRAGRHRRDERRHRRLGPAPPSSARGLRRGDRRAEGHRPALEEGDVRGG